MVRDFKTVDDVNYRINMLKMIIDELIDIEKDLYNYDTGLSAKRYIESLENDLEYCLLKKYKMENGIKW